MTFHVFPGEKISYGITVLLALAVFLSITSATLPRSGDRVPALTYYMCVALCASFLEVVDSILIVYLYSLKKKRDKDIKTLEKLKGPIASWCAKTPAKKRASFGDVVGLKTTSGNAVYPEFISGVQVSTDKIGDAMQNDAKVGLGNGEKSNVCTQDNTVDDTPRKEDAHNKYTVVCQYIDLVSFIVFLLMWLIVTLVYFIQVTQ